MYNWNTDTSELKKNPETYAIWKIEQCVNYGLDGEKLKIAELKKYWNKLSLDPAKRKLLTFWIWGIQS